MILRLTTLHENARSALECGPAMRDRLGLKAKSPSADGYRTPRCLRHNHFHGSEASPQLLLVQLSRKTAEMLRCAQHDRFEFLHTFSAVGTGCVVFGQPPQGAASALRRFTPRAWWGTDVAPAGAPKILLDAFSPTASAVGHNLSALTGFRKESSPPAYWLT